MDDNDTMYFDDLTAYHYYLPFDLVEVRNIGWLDASHPYPKGEAPEGFIAKLREVICSRQEKSDTHANIIRGIHPCGLCGEERIESQCAHGLVVLGMSEIWLQTSHGYFASPSMILHYVEAHGYVPPREYVDAVMAFDPHEPFNAQEIYDGLLAKHT